MHGFTLYNNDASAGLEPSSVDFDSNMERGILSFKKALSAGSKAQLKIAFEGQLTGAMMGYYRSVGGEDGKKVYALTQFEVFNNIPWPDRGTYRTGSLRPLGVPFRAGTSHS